MNDDEFIPPDAVIDQEGIAGDRKDTHARQIGLPPKAWVLGQQLACLTYLAQDRGGGSFVVT
jgi:hypothetical protein